MPIFKDNPALWLQFRRGDPAALDKVYRFYSPKIAQLILRRSAIYRGQRSAPRASEIFRDISDLVHEVFIRAFSRQAREAFDPTREYGPYIYSIGRHVLADGRRRRREVPMDESSLAAAADASNDADAHLEDDWSDAQMVAGVSRYLASLNPAARRIFEKRYVEDLSQHAAARALGISRQTLRTGEIHLRRGLLAALSKE